MPIKRINEFPEGSGSLSSDDIFLFMDDPSGDKVTKKISLSQLSAVIGVSGGGGGSGNPFDQNLNTFDSPTFNTLLVSGHPLNFGQNVDKLGPPVAGGGTDRIRLWDFEGTGSNFNYAIGAEGNHVWFAMDVNNGTGGFKFYSRDNQIFKISDDSKLVFPNNTTVAPGTFDNGTSGYSGISLNCAVGYELNWQGGHLKNTYDGGVTSVNILADSAIEFPGSGIDNVQIDSTGITFSDNTKQITAWTGYITSSSVTDFNSAVSGLLPVKNIVSGTGISVTNSSGIYTINSTGSGTYSDQSSSLVTTVFNETGSAIPKMTAVYINGGHGDRPTVALAVASGDPTSAGTYGLTLENIGDMQLGRVVAFGALTGVNTDPANGGIPGAVEGSVLYLSPTTPGGITTTKPSAPNHIVTIGTVVRVHQNAGVIEVRIVNGFELEELHNVSISGVSDNQVLMYDSATSLWKNETLPSSSTTVVSLSYSSGITTNASAGDIFDITASGSLTLNNPTNSVNGKTLRWRISQDNTGNRSITLGNKFKIPSSASDPLPWSTSGNAMDILAATYHAGRDKWDVIAFVPGY